jgi:hypothetical protein
MRSPASRYRNHSEFIHAVMSPFYVRLKTVLPCLEPLLERLRTNHAFYLTLATESAAEK